MLTEIYIENIALIDKLRLQFGKGFNVLTGETGAGKSILLDAISLILGIKADSTLIRHGSNKALVEAVFCNLPDNILNKMAHYGLEGEELILTREITSGRSICRINGRNFPLNIFREFGERLINIYGQHDYQTLVNRERHLEILDDFDKNIKSVKEKVTEAAQKIAVLNKEMQLLEKEAAEAIREYDYLQFQYQEIENANLRDGEEEELLAAQKIAEHAEKIVAKLSDTYTLLYGSKDKNISDLLAIVQKNLLHISEYADDLQAFAERINAISLELDETALDIKAYLDSLEFNPDEAARIEDRLYTIKTLKRKYGSTIKEVIEYQKNIADKINRINSKEEILQELKQQIRDAQEKYHTYADELSNLRKKSAQKFEKELKNILAEMNMKAELKVHFVTLEGFSAQGKETVEFLIKTNVGETFKPLAKIASGGELSRFMLALRTLTNEIDHVPTLIFDEIDAGMGGVTLGKVAHKMLALAKEAQVLCVTHAAQLAAKAQHHYIVEKEEIDKQTITKVKKLEHHERIKEIARMLDGMLTNSALQHAEELLHI